MITCMHKTAFIQNICNALNFFLMGSTDDRKKLLNFRNDLNHVLNKVNP